MKIYYEIITNISMTSVLGLKKIDPKTSKKISNYLSNYFLYSDVYLQQIIDQISTRALFKSQLIFLENKDEENFILNYFKKEGESVNYGKFISVYKLISRKRKLKQLK
jgi:hypothetical protein